MLYHNQLSNIKNLKGFEYINFVNNLENTNDKDLLLKAINYSNELAIRVSVNQNICDDILKKLIELKCPLVISNLTQKNK